jgi:terminal uridylyltransferase
MPPKPHSYGPSPPGYPDFASPQFHPGLQHPHSTDGAAGQIPVMHPDAVSPRVGRSGQGTLFNPHGQQMRPDEVVGQVAFLDRLCTTIVANAEIERDEIAEKEAFRVKIEQVCREAILRFEVEQNNIQDFDPASVQLKCFGSLSSGFATKASDMDLGLLSPRSHVQPDAPGSPIPRLVEKALLDIGLGSRLLTRTRVPIIKLCEKPTKKLYGDLIEEREKWDRGLQADGADEDIHDDGNATHELERTDDTAVGTTTTRENSSLGDTAITEKRLMTLKQSQNQSLTTYYGRAKRLLRNLGGCDVTITNYRDFGEDDIQRLTSVTEAFIQGLHDPELRARLGGLGSDSETKNSNMLARFRSLLAAYTQVEGEHILMRWENRQVHERTSKLREQCDRAADTWRDLQNKPYSKLDPIQYTKELQHALSRLVSMPSVQLVILEQAEHESPTEYLSRAVNILNSLDRSDLQDKAVVQRAITQQYISGIRPVDIRQGVQGFFDLSAADLSLRTICLRHKSLQLAREFERAVEKGLYEPNDVEDIKQYVLILRQPLRRLPNADGPDDYVVPITKSTANIAKKMETLPDPATMAPNRPRDPYRDRLEFPKSGVGVQCDINFSAHLALQNTLLLRCYSHTDVRVRPLVLFVKHWAKVRGINSGYRGTLSSYGYVLMMLHYLVNVAYPFVCPNLQKLARQPQPNIQTEEQMESMVCKGRDVAFWRNEEEILQLARTNQLNSNRESVGSLLRGFFEYYAHSDQMSTVPRKGFDWGREVLSLRTQGGLLSKQKKGWTGAKTVYQVQPGPNPSPVAETPRPFSESQQSSQTDLESLVQTAAQPTDVGISSDSTKVNPSTRGRELKEIRHRYLLAIEDPFELDHNVARTVTHNGIVAIRDEFRRAWRIIRSSGHSIPEEDLLQDANAEKVPESKPYLHLLKDLHGWELFE